MIGDGKKVSARSAMAMMAALSVAGGLGGNQAHGMFGPGSEPSPKEPRPFKRPYTPEEEKELEELSLDRSSPGRKKYKKRRNEIDAETFKQDEDDSDRMRMQPYI